MKPLRGLKQAVGRYQRESKKLHCIIYLDTEDGQIWTNVYAGENDFSNYHDKSIRALNTYFTDANQCEYVDLKINMHTVRRTAEYVRKLYETTP